MSASYCSQVQDGFVPPLAVLVLVLVAELCGGALDELEGLQHGGRVGHVGLTAGETGFCNGTLCCVAFLFRLLASYLTMPLSFSEDGSVPLTIGSVFLSDGLSPASPARPSSALTL